MDKVQKATCQRVLRGHAAQAAEIAVENSRVRYLWSNTGMFVTSSSQRKRRVDAVTDPNAFTVTIDRENFLTMPRSVRITLLTHEIFHLITVDGKLIDDERSFPGFSSGQKLLDSLGASTAVAAHRLGVVSDFVALENVSRAYKPYLVQIDVFKNIWSQQKTAKALLRSSISQGGSIFAVFKPGLLGTRLGGEFINSQSKYKGITVSENISLLAAGLGLHVNPINEGLTRWREMQISLYLDALYGGASYKLAENELTLADRSVVKGGQASIQAHIPLWHGFWLVTGFQLRKIRYEYQSIGPRIDEVQTTLFLGGAYGF